MGKTIAVIGALDTKGEEFQFVKKEIEKRNHAAQVIAPGCVDMANFWARDTVPERYDHRRRCRADPR